MNIGENRNLKSLILALGFKKKKYEYWPKNELKSLILAFGFKKKV